MVSIRKSCKEPCSYLPNGKSRLKGPVQTACQQACPTGAISFGNLVDPQATVGRQWLQQQAELGKDKQAKDAGHAAEETIKLRGYRILEELRTYPSVMYLEQVRESAI